MKSDKEIKESYLNGNYTTLKDSERVRCMVLIENKEITDEDIKKVSKIYL